VAIIAIVCILVGLATFGVIREKYYPYLIYAISLGLLLQVTLASPTLVGTDIHLEYYFANLTEKEGWDTSIPYLNNSAFGIVILAPWIAKILHIDMLWVLKVIFPILFAGVPLLLYFVFKEWVTSKQAFLSAFFFVSMPTYFTELTGIARQQIAEVFLAACIFFIVVVKLELKWKLPIVILLALLVAVSHYSIGPILLFVLIVGFVVQLVLKTNIKFPAWAFALTVIILTISSVFYYHNVASGQPLRYMTALIPVETQQVGPFTIGPMYPPFPPDEILCPPGQPKSEETPGTPPDTSPDTPSDTSPIVSYFSNHEGMVKSAMGMDFVGASVAGKIFRVLQYITQIVIVVGFFMFLRGKKRSYYVLATSCALLLALCIFVPGVSSILNITRFYHLSLFLLAPAFIVGGELVFRNLKVVAVCILIPYFLFTSGFVFEAIKSEEITKLDIPYSVPLSDYRIDLGGSPTQNDMLVRDWIAENDPTPLYADYFGVLFLQETLGTKKIYCLPEDCIAASWNMEDMDIPEGSFIFLRERGVATFWAGIGLRRQYTYDEIGLDKFGDIVYSVGKAEVRLVD